MNKKILLSMLFSFGLCFTGCDDYLDVHPATGFTEAEVFSSESEIKSAVAGVYTLMLTDDAYSNRLAFVFNPNTDVEMAGISTNTVNVNGSDIACFEPKPYWTTLNSTWNAMYKIINNANDVIQGIEVSDVYKNASKTEPSNITQMYGEVKTIRAMVYLDMIRIWGDVVFRTTSSTGDEDFRVGVTDRNKILEFLIDDLKSAEPLMQYASALDYGPERASRSFNQGLIGLLALTRGGWTLRPESDPASIGQMVRGENHELYYDIAIEYLGKVINEGQHDLKLSYRNFWIGQNNWVTPINDDVMFSLPLLKGVSGEYGYAIGIPIVEGSHAYGSASGNVSLAGTYLYSFDNKDLRRDVTCGPYSFDANLNQVIRLDLAKLAVAKWSKLYTSPMGSASQKGTGINYSWMRFADVLLMYAEAVNERFGPRQDAQECLKRVRRRAFSPADWPAKVDSYVSSKSNPDLFFQAIMDERAWEFGGESKRKFDLARWNKYSEVIYNQYNKFVNWGKVANGAYVPGIDQVPGSIYWKNIPSPNNAGKTILDIKGIDEILQATPAGGYTELAFARSWYALNNETASYEPRNDIKWSFRGFINFNNATSKSPNDPLRYLCPYPSKVISDHRGAIQNYYGFNY
jgi:hypothetical protein